MSNTAWFNHHKAILEEHSESEGPLKCQIWKRGGVGKPGHKYGTVRVKFPWRNQSQNVYVHRLSYMCYRKSFNLPKALHVSHLCHNTLCINPEHLSLEPQHINNARKNCTGRVPPECCGHGIYPKCMFFNLFFLVLEIKYTKFTPWHA